VLAVSIDTLVENVHFFSDVGPEKLGHKSLAVSLSDLAAMGATPAWFTLALTLPRVDRDWLKGFSKGLAKLANQHHIQLIGGDTTRGPLAISIQVHGHVKPQEALRRDGAKPGDLIYVTGTLGDAGAGLDLKLNKLPSQLSSQDKNYLVARLEQPTPRNDVSTKLRTVASAAIDISDGLLADLGHILDKSQVGAQIHAEKLPLSVPLQKLEKQQALTYALTAGDDYELCFTIPPSLKETVETLLAESCTLIGEITETKGMVLINGDGSELQLKEKGYDHFN
jgi:thiamine-monophosphate kinase